MVVKIYGMPYSTCTQKVLATLYEKNIEFEMIPIHLMKGEHKTPEHIARHPFGKIPVMDDDGFMLYESQAICRYLDKKSGPKLIPSDLKAGGIVDQWISVFSSYFNDTLFKITAQRIMAPMRGGTPDEAVCKQAVEDLEKILPILEKHVSTNEFIAGKEFTFADIIALPYFFYVQMTPEGNQIRSKYTHVAKWLDRCYARPSYLKVKADFDKVMAQK